MELRLAQGKLVDREEKDMVQNEAKKWRQILITFLDIIWFLSKQNLALRSHGEDVHNVDVENKGNFLELVHLMAKFDPILREHLVRMKLGKKFTTSYLI